VLIFGCHYETSTAPISFSFLVFSFSSSFASISSFTQKIEQGKILFSQRARVEKSKEAAIVFSEAYALGKTTKEKAFAKIKEAEALYYYADLLPASENAMKIALHEKAFKGVESIRSLLQKQSTEEFPAPLSGLEWELSQVHYWYGANKGKWGQARGVIVSLMHWWELKRRMIFLGTNSSMKAGVEDYGYARILGRGIQKVPVERNKVQGLEVLERANRETLATITVKQNQVIKISKNSTNVLYLLDMYAYFKNKAKFCDLYLAFTSLQNSSQSIKNSYNPSRIPELARDLREFSQGSDFQNLRNFAQSSNCLVKEDSDF